MNKINQENGQNEHRQNILKMLRSKWILKIITLCALLYLSMIPFGRVTKKYESTDVAIFIIVLLFNSGLIERLEKFSYKNGELSLDLAQLKEQQDKQKANIEANTSIIQRLTDLERVIANSAQEKELIYKSLIDENELQHLQRLASDKEYLQYELKHSAFQQELRRLRALGFIENQPGKHIGSMNYKGNLREYVKLTERGREYLNYLSKQVEPVKT